MQQQGRLCTKWDENRPKSSQGRQTHADLHAEPLKEGPVNIIKDRVVCFHGTAQSWEKLSHQQRKRKLIPGTETGVA